ncbi:Crotonobetainyl-CoA:carnitine CoA-transferase CaiB [Novosphingobium sp. CF614]|uniref:CaiB/BaiF CoA transferase family protein n=1 Tax=Novosphingobium sp. CF614 TaxID=1884364 RepID=UPI0008F3DB91|nr:CoA transferase [Novosphingobium sp. CF614]SFF77200.1 Crotonobetainyl-CoA:carnitine CoA-transferase CaiB [Novosphingobium sp. CF614]
MADATQTKTGAAMPALLGGLRVVELASDRAAYAGKLMGDLGADVIVVEAPGGHASRGYGPFVDDKADPDRCLWWWNYNTSKRSVVLDLATEAGRADFRRLAGSADIVLEGEDPGVLDALGIDHTQIRADLPGLVWVSVTPNGRRCPELHEPTTDLTILAAGGLVWNCGYDDHSLPPVRPSGGHAQHTASAFAVMGALTAVVHRDVSGIGQHVDVSMLAATNVTTEVSSVDFLYRRATNQRQTGRHASEHNTMGIQTMTGDGGYASNPLGLTTAGNYQAVLDWLRELGLEDQFPEAFFLQMGIDRGGVSLKVLGQDVEATEIYRAGREALYLIASQLTTPEFFVQAQQRGIACGAVYAPDEALADAHFRFRGYPVEVEHPELGRSFTYPGLPFAGEAIPQAIRRAPLVGEHTEEVLAELE